MKCRKDCYYYGRNTDSCDFYLVTGVRRGCDPDDCNRYKNGKRKAVLPENFVKEINKASKKKKSVSKYASMYDQMYALWLEGKSDGQIASEIGCSKKTAQLWRNRNCLPTQKQRKELELEKSNRENERGA